MDWWTTVGWLLLNITGSAIFQLYGDKFQEFWPAAGHPCHEQLRTEPIPDTDTVTPEKVSLTSLPSDLHLHTVRVRRNSNGDRLIQCPARIPLDNGGLMKDNKWSQKEKTATAFMDRWIWRTIKLRLFVTLTLYLGLHHHFHCLERQYL